MSKSKGFTLVELSIVVTIIGLLFTGAMMGVPMMLNKVKQEQTKEKIDVVLNSLSSYVQRHNRLPCPADPTATGAARGTEKMGGGCFDGADVAELMNNMEGLVPWRELGISERDAVDAWGKYLTYRPAPHLTLNNFALQAQSGMMEDSDAQIHNACRSPVWYNAAGQHLDRAKALFVCNAQPSEQYLDEIVGSNVLGDAATVSDWKSVALAIAGSTAADDVAASNSWRDSYTADDGGDLLYAGRFDRSISGMADSSLGRATSTAVTIISHGGNNTSSYLRDGTRQAGDTSSVDEQKNVDDGDQYMGAVATPKSGVLRGAGRAGGVFDDIVVALRSDQLYAKVGGPTVSALRPSSAGEISSDPAPPAPSDCVATIVNWTVGANSCSASLGSGVFHGSGTGAVANTLAGFSGSASFTCQNGAYVENPGSTCEAQCPATTLNWSESGQNCESAVVATLSGGTVNLTDSVQNSTGSATFTCNNGTWSAPASPDCNTQCLVGVSVSWTDGSTSRSCDATTTATVSNGNTNAITDSSGPDLGAATATCNNGTWSASGTCARQCAGATLSWTVGLDTCEAAAATVNDGGSSGALTDSIATAIGSASFTCDNGTWAVDAGATCTSGCVGGAVSWTVGGNTCNGTVTNTTPGNNVVASDVTVPTSGSATFRCFGDCFVLQAGATCNVAVNGACATHGSYYGAQPGTNTATGCTAGTYADAGDTASQWSWQCVGAYLGTTATCFANKAQCSGAVSWTQGAYTCNATAGLTNSGSSTPTFNDVTVPHGGTASFACNNGVLTPEAGATCTDISTCNAQHLCWTVNGNSCMGYVGSTPNANSAVATDAAPGFVGSANFTCTGGAFVINSGATCDGDGACGSANGSTSTTAPSSNLCGAGVPTGVTTNATTYTWSCNGSGGGTNASCTANRQINASCGTANGVAVGSAPAVNLCSAGTAGGVTTNATTYTWNCTGINGGSNSACSAPRMIAGACAAFGAYYASQPATTTANGCTAGTYDNSTPADTTAQWRWSCTGINGAATANCAANKAQCSGAVSWGAGCTGTAALTNSGGNTASIANTNGSYTGSAIFSCNNGVKTYSSGTCTVNTASGIGCASCPAGSGSTASPPLGTFHHCNLAAAGYTEGRSSSDGGSTWTPWGTAEKSAVCGFNVTNYHWEMR